MSKLKNKICLVTGGTGLIGREIINEFLYERAIVIFTFNKNISEAKKICKLKKNLYYHKLNIAQKPSIKKLFKFIGKKFNKLDVIVNNAGINKIDNIYNIKTEDWNKIQEINLTGPMLLTKFVSKKMIKKRNGKILNISSIFGVVGKSKRSSYSSSKWGLIGLTKSTALDLAKYNILVNSISPGVIESDLTTKILGKKGIQEIQKLIPMKRLSKMSEIVHLIAFVVSDYNSYITGQNFIIDGGYTSG